ncbi:MAG TPA: GNAT family N-acetyltransferase [Gaiellaceae bacterium]|nr:GNAT family N-acetyltransferase [Gaiellaceae bacterium]
MGEVEIVGAGPERLDDLEPLWQAMHAHHESVAGHLEAVAPFRSPEDSWRRRRAHYERVLADPETFLLLAERDGRAVGCALVLVKGTEASLEVGERVADLDTLSVLPEERGRGLGGRLLDAVDAELRRRGIGELSLAVMVGNDDAVRLYERRGLVPYLTFLIGPVPPE